MENGSYQIIIKNILFYERQIINSLFSTDINGKWLFEEIREGKWYSYEKHTWKHRGK